MLCAAQALAMQDAYEAEDEIDDAADDAAEAQQRRSRAAAIASGSQLPDNSAYFHERLYWGRNTRATWHSVLMQGCCYAQTQGRRHCDCIQH